MDEYKNTDNANESRDEESSVNDLKKEENAAEEKAKDTTPPPFSESCFSHTGEYRYAPPYTDKNARDSVYGAEKKAPQGEGSSYGSQYTPPRPPEKKPRKVRTFSTAAIALLIAGSVILSLAAGMCGALLVNGGFSLKSNAEGNEANSKGDSSSGKTTLIIHQSDSAAEGSAGNLEGTYDISDVCAAVSPCVVEVSTEFNKIIYGQYHYVQEGAGSGVIISADGYILTNAHVITDSQSGDLADAVTIRLNNSDEYEAEIIGSDPASDIALLKIDAEKLEFATMGNSDSINVGQQIIAVGNPLGELGGTVTCGIISATDREITVENNKMTLIQIDAAINPGNSGGGLFNTRGELVGIVNAKTTDVTVEGLGFAIPVNDAITVAAELQEYGYVTGKPYVGISLVDVTTSYEAYTNFGSSATGVYIILVQEGYNDSALKYGDRITAINDNEITTVAEAKEIISESQVGDVLIFTVARGKRLYDIEVKCYEYVPENGVSFDD